MLLQPGGRQSKETSLFKIKHNPNKKKIPPKKNPKPKQKTNHKTKPPVLLRYAYTDTHKKKKSDFELNVGARIATAK